MLTGGKLVLSTSWRLVPVARGIVEAQLQDDGLPGGQFGGPGKRLGCHSLQNPLGLPGRLYFNLNYRVCFSNQFIVFEIVVGHLPEKFEANHDLKAAFSCTGTCSSTVVLTRLQPHFLNGSRHCGLP